MITPYSIVSAIIWSNFFIIFLYLVRTKKFAREAFNFFPLFLIYVVCILRLFICFDLPFTKGIFVNKWLVTFIERMRNPMFSVLSTSFSFRDIFICIWIVGTLVTTVGLIVCRVEFKNKCTKYNREVDETVISMAEEISKDYKASRYRIFVNPLVREPLVCGVFSYTIVLPDYMLSREEISYVLEHEFLHIVHHDTLIKMFVALVRAAFWWNPFSSLFVKEINHVLELRNDSKLIQGKSQEYRHGYASAIVSVAKKAVHKQSSFNGDREICCGFVSRKQVPSITQRVNLVLNYKTPPRVQRLLVYTLIVCVFFASHSIVIQPGWEPGLDEGETFVLDRKALENSYFVQKDNGMYEMIINGESYGEVYPEETEKPPFNEIKIIDN